MFLSNGIVPSKEQLSSIPLKSIQVSPSEIDGGISEEAQNFLKKRGK
jgi:hypothetical protein